MKFTFMRTYRHEFSISGMCRALEVVRGSYYSWCSRAESNKKKRDKFLTAEISAAHEKSRRIYGSPKIHRELCSRGIKCGHNRIAKLMKLNGIRAKMTKRFKKQFSSVGDAVAAPNVVNRNFNPKSRDLVYVLDTTFVWTSIGWAYLCACIDLFNKEVIGWHVSKHCDAEAAVTTLDKAIQRRKPSAGLIVHTDRGSQFDSAAFKKIIKDNDFVRSMSRKGNCWDNACAESFFGHLKTEWLTGMIFNATYEVHSACFDYIEVFYNRKRQHASLGYVSPADYGKDVRKIA